MQLHRQRLRHRDPAGTVAGQHRQRQPRRHRGLQRVRCRLGAARRVNADFGANRGWTTARHPRLLADVTGEGWADVVGFGNGGVYVGLANGSGGFGGGPEVATVPSLRGLSYDVARARLAAEGLRVGSIRSVVDRTCEDIDKVLSSNPSAGTEVAVGTAVNLSVGVKPPTPCP